MPPRRRVGRERLVSGTTKSRDGTLITGILVLLFAAFSGAAGCGNFVGDFPLGFDAGCGNFVGDLATGFDAGAFGAGFGAVVFDDFGAGFGGAFCGSLLLLVAI